MNPSSVCKPAARGAGGCETMGGREAWSNETRGVLNSVLVRVAAAPNGVPTPPSSCSVLSLEGRGTVSPAEGGSVGEDIAERVC